MRRYQEVEEEEERPRPPNPVSVEGRVRGTAPVGFVSLRPLVSTEERGWDIEETTPGEVEEGTVTDETLPGPTTRDVVVRTPDGGAGPSDTGPEWGKENGAEDQDSHTARRTNPCT